MRTRWFALSFVLFALVPVLAADPPKPVRENIEWLDVWVPDNAVTDKPRVLLVGDSITRGYYKDVETRLKGKATVGRLTTSKSLGDPGFIAEVQLVLGATKFDVIHFNNGLHGWGYTEEQYAKAFPELLAAFRKGAPDAKLIWATTTPVRVADKLSEISEKTARVKERNKLAATVMSEQKIPTNDLFAVLESHPELYSRDGVHLNAKGTTALAEQVANIIEKVLSGK